MAGTLGLGPRSKVKPGAAGRRLGVRGGVRGAEEGLTVGEDGVDLPALATGRALGPELVLLGVATRRAALVDRRQPEAGQPRLLGVHLVRGADLDAEVVER